MASWVPVYLTIPEYVFTLANTNKLVIINNIKVLERGSHCKLLNTKFFFSTNAIPKEKQVTPMSSKKIIHRGTIFIFFNIVILFEDDIKLLSH
jgi:hypothetical protein